MASILSSLKPKTKLAWQIVWPLVLVLVIAGGWSAYWFIASTTAGEILDRVLVRQKAKGLVISCANRHISGYPFKFLLTCDQLKVVRETSSRLTSLTASRLVVVVRAYDFNHMIAELYGPFDISRGRKRDANSTVVETRKLFYGTAKTVTASLILKNRVLKEATAIVRGLKGTLVEYSNRTTPQNIATSLEEAIVHIRSTGDTSKPVGPYKVAGVLKEFLLVGGSANFQSDKGTRLDDVNVRMNISNAPYRLSGKPLDWLKLWKANAGEAKIIEASATSGELKIKGSGQFNLDDLGRVQGVLNNRMTGLDDLIKQLVASGKIREQDANFGLTAIKLLSNAGGGSVKIALRAKKGNVYFGPFKIAILKPLFKL